MPSLTDRREALKLIAAGAMVSRCGKPSEQLVANVEAPGEIIAGQGDFYATASVVGGYADGILVHHRLGRPMKIEGNPDHPASLGATDAIGQAQILDLYDSDRARDLTRNHRPVAVQTLEFALKDARDGLRILTGTVTSPTLAAQIKSLNVPWHVWDALSRDNVRAGAEMAFGRPLDTIPLVDRCDVILALDSDLVSGAPGHLRFARELASRRNPTRTQKMSRIYAVEPSPTLLGAIADHRFTLGQADLEAVLWQLSAAILRGEPTGEGAPPWLGALIDDLKTHRGRCLVHVGAHQPPAAHALVHHLNRALNAPLRHIAPVEAMPIDHRASLKALIDDMAGGRVKSLLILGTNPAFSAPADMNFLESLKRVPNSYAMNAQFDETALVATWQIPESHLLESWGDAAAFDGTATILQPQTKPLFGGFNRHLILSWIGGESAKPLDLLKRQWFGRDWHESLATGVIPGTAAPEVQPAFREPPQGRPHEAGGLTLLFRPDPYLADGSYANNPWLQEAPRSFTKIVWNNPLIIAPELAQDLKLEDGDLVRVEAGPRQLEMPVKTQPGQAKDCLIAHFGFGRRVVGQTGAGRGCDVFVLRSASALDMAFGVRLTKTGRSLRLAATEHHDPMEQAAIDRVDDIVRSGTLSELAAFAAQAPVETLYGPDQLSQEVAWGMSIDLNACIGCNACVVACMAENNVPVVGPEEVMRGHEMHWLRIDRYYDDTEDPQILFQPLLCMQCEHAPCEVVCPVGATVHDHEGLNVMVYNRCIGTRFCSNNCPYKVRRFNYFAFSHEEVRNLDSRNPDVTVRGRGVMEKCTFCIQRIAHARIEADKSGGRLPEVQTACQAACPTRAFTFGNQADKASEVAGRKASPLSYLLLGELNTRPRVSYEARILNPNPAIPS